MRAAWIAALAFCAVVGVAAVGPVVAQEARAEVWSRFTGPSVCMGTAEERGLRVPRMAPCGTGPGQAWIVRHEDGTPWERLIAADDPATCLDVIADGPNDRLWVGPCGNYGSQFWTLEPVPGDPQGAVSLVNAFAGADRCLEVVNDGAANDRLRMKACDVWSSQKWLMRALPAQ